MDAEVSGIQRLGQNHVPGTVFMGHNTMTGLARYKNDLGLVYRVTGSGNAQEQNKDDFN
jgi:hypothetical protein